MQTLNKEVKKQLQAVLSDTEKNLSPFACMNDDCSREFSSKYDRDLLRTQFAIDTDKILHSALYNRGNDKTQVFSFYRNDDISRRSTHVQLVSRISRIIGRALRLNLDLIESIAIGHDIGHTPFGHKGEEFLNNLYFSRTNRYFNHNVHSTRVLQRISRCNLTLQTLDGIICHCGEKAFQKYEPSTISTFAQHNEMVEQCYATTNYNKKLRPSTLEGCVVRISDMIAYIGKDRQDAKKVKLTLSLEKKPLGENNAEIITNIVTDIIVNSLEQPYLSMSSDVFDGITEILDENSNQIYQCADVTQPYFETIQPMMELMYERFLNDLYVGDFKSPIYQHYLNNSIIGNFYRVKDDKSRIVRFDIHNPNDIVVDFIASMTDDYFIDAFNKLFPHHELASKIKYIEYFDKRYTK